MNNCTNKLPTLRQSGKEGQSFILSMQSNSWSLPKLELWRRGGLKVGGSSLETAVVLFL